MADPRTPEPLPPPLMTSEPGSFAQATVLRRLPQIINDVLQDNSYPPEIRGALCALAEEVACGPVRPLGAVGLATCGGPLRPLAEPAPDRDYWQAQWRPYAGRTWLDVPWYFAEAFFYRRLLETVRYFQPGLWEGRDPFAAQKRRQLDGPGGALPLAGALLAKLPADPRAAAKVLLHASLWGNRIDLSNREMLARLGHQPVQAGDILIDDSDRVLDLLSRGVPEGLSGSGLGCARGAQTRIAFINDNAGPELTFDLLLADHLLERGWAQQVRLHLKPYPFYVSDATIPDVRELLARLQGSDEPRSRAAGERLSGRLAMGTLDLATHPFWASSYAFFELPADLRQELASVGLVIVKGDANYRRLLGDRHWPHTARLEEITAYFPASYVTLRTLKAEIMVGLAAGQAEALAAEDADWLINGRRGVLHLVAQPA